MNLERQLVTGKSEIQCKNPRTFTGINNGQECAITKKATQVYKQVKYQHDQDSCHIILK